MEDRPHRPATRFVFGNRKRHLEELLHHDYADAYNPAKRIDLEKSV
jgi:hypothetical protein